MQELSLIHVCSAPDPSRKAHTKHSINILWRSKCSPWIIIKNLMWRDGKHFEEGWNLFLRQREVTGHWPALGRYLGMRPPTLITWSYVMQIAFLSLRTLVMKYDYFLKVRKVQMKLKLSESFIVCKEREVAGASSSYPAGGGGNETFCPKYFGWCVHVSEGSGKRQLFQAFRTEEM